MNINYWKWPATPQNDLAPWYTILRRSFGLPFIGLSVAFIYLGGLIGWGHKEGKWWTKEVWDL